MTKTEEKISEQQRALRFAHRTLADERALMLKVLHLIRANQYAPAEALLEDKLTEIGLVADE